MTEVNVIELEKNNHAFYNILVSLISGSCEEEKDVSGETNELSKEFSPYLHLYTNLNLYSSSIEFSEKHSYISLKWRNTLREVYSPPPES